MSIPLPPLPEPAAWQRLVNDPDDAPHYYWDDCGSWEAMNCTPANARRELFTADQMHAHAAAVTAADNAALRAELAQAMKERARAIAVGDDIEQEVERLRERIKVLEDALQGLMAGCKYYNIQGQWHWHEKSIATNAALDAARAALGDKND